MSILSRPLCSTPWLKGRPVSTIGMYIHGAYRNTRGQQFASIDPSDQSEIAWLTGGTKEDVDDLVESSREGFEVWKRYSGVERGRILHRAQMILRERASELAELESKDSGKTLFEAENFDMPTVVDTIEFYAGLSSTLCVEGKTYPVSGSLGFTLREPLGVCVGIGAWNYPLQIAAWKSAPALACGNSMIFKPASLTPLSAFKLAEVYTEAGLPPGVFNVVPGREAAEALVAHTGVAKTSLTGEVGTGKRIMSAAAKSLKKVTMELGGKSPLLIFSDCDLQQAVNGAMAANFFSQGQVCSNGTRVFVQRDIYHSFCEEVARRTEGIVVGNPRDPATSMGPLISEGHLGRVLQFVKKGVEEGATLIAGSPTRLDVEGMNGNFMRPVVFKDCSDEMTIVKEEIFGPVMAILPFDSEEEVMERANASEFGLAAGVFTSDVGKAMRCVKDLEAGTCWVNTFNVTPPELPFGGHKTSGIGRENSVYAIDYYSQIKSVYVEGQGIEGLPF